MNALVAGFPDVYRYAKSELKPGRLAFGAVGSLVLGACLLVTIGEAEGAPTFFQWILGLQAIVLLGYGTARTASSVISERQEGTWDLQRLTPLSPFQLALGKLAGAPLYAAYLALTLFPWALCCFFFTKPLEPRVFVAGYAALGAAAFMAFSIGLVISAYSAEAVGGSYSSTTGVLAGLFAVQSFLPVVAATARDSASLPFYGLQLSLASLWSMSALSLGLWAFLGAKWRIGKELLEGPRWWRLPAFLLFMVAYELGWFAHAPSVPFGGALLAPALFVYMAAVLNGEGADHWKRWLGPSEAGARWHRVPVWVNGVETYAALAAASLAFDRAGSNEEWRLYPLLQTAFLARDLMFLQWCRLQGLKRPEVVALVTLAFAYALPAIVIGTVGGWTYRFVYVPVPNTDCGLALNLAPGLLQAGAMAWALSRRLRPSLARP